MNVAQAKKFKLPSIFGQKTNEAPTAAGQSKFTNLSELANAHLSSTKSDAEPQKMKFSQSINIPQKPNGSKFVIPKLNCGSGSDSVSPSLNGESLTPHEMSIKKIMDLKRLSISSANDTENTPPKNTIDNPNVNISQSQQYPIDLASALNGPNIVGSVVVSAKSVAEKIDFKFIDCDIAEKLIQPLNTQDCCLNISNILEKRFENRTKSTTAFGKILCSKYRHRKQSVIYHGFESKHKIKPFRFDVSNTASSK